MCSCRGEAQDASVRPGFARLLDHFAVKVAVYGCVNFTLLLDAAIILDPYSDMNATKNSDSIKGLMVEYMMSSDIPADLN